VGEHGLFTMGILLNLPALLCVALLTTTLTTAEAHAADPAPTNVQISWKDGTFQQVRVSWVEASARPNVVVLRKKGNETRYLRLYVAADAPDVLDIDASRIRDYAWYDSSKPLEIGVAAGTSTEETSAVGVSAPFDAFTPDPRERVSVVPTGTSTLTVKWRPSIQTDLTPNDPLDRNLALTYQPSYTNSAGTKVAIGTRTSATQVTFTGPKPLFRFNVMGFNEWGGQFEGAGVNTETTRLTAKIPAWAVYGFNTSKVTGTYMPAEERRQVVLQARNSSTSPWYVVASDTFSGGKYSFDLGTGGSRQYRVAVPNTSYYSGVLVSYGAVSAPARRGPRSARSMSATATASATFAPWSAAAPLTGTTSPPARTAASASRRRTPRPSSTSSSTRSFL
jgi:hypothetical protein